MPKNILIFSDGTGQVGGMRPDQNLSNIYKMYRAMRPGPASPIKPSTQVCFYDPGLGSGPQTGLFNLNRVRKLLSSAVGSGIDENVIDCYEKIISYYEPGDRIVLFGFSRGAYTVRTVANVMQLCGIPTHAKDDPSKPIPRAGPELRKIASDAVNYVYNFGTGRARDAEPFAQQRQILAKRFRTKYGSTIERADGTGETTVQPYFVGVFDTVAALQINVMRKLTRGLMVLLLALLIIAMTNSWGVIATAAIALPLVVLARWYCKLVIKQFKFFTPDGQTRLSMSKPRHWLQIWRSGHLAAWNSKHYDRTLSRDVRFARHALAIDEQRKDFSLVEWGNRADIDAAARLQPRWLKQVWFAGCHSDIGGSYPEPESRLSDISLDWMIQELTDCIPDIEINHEQLVRSPDPTGMQHQEIYLKRFGNRGVAFKQQPRSVPDQAEIHMSVYDRLAADMVSHNGMMKPYRPEQLNHHHAVKMYLHGLGQNPSRRITQCAKPTAKHTAAHSHPNHRETTRRVRRILG